MASDNRVIAAMLTSGALGDQSGALKSDAKEHVTRWIVDIYREILKELDALDPEEKTGALGFGER